MADVDLAVQHYRRSVARCVDRGIGAQRLHAGADKEGHVSELGAVFGFERGLGAFADFGDARHVRFVDGVDVRRNVLGGHHVLGNALAHHAHGLRLILAEIDPLARHGVLQHGMRQRAASSRRRGRSRCWRRGEWRRRGKRRCWSGGFCAACRQSVQNIFLADAPARAASFHGRQIHVVFLRELADQRRAANFLAVATCLLRGCRRRHACGCCVGGAGAETAGAAGDTGAFGAAAFSGAGAAAGATAASDPAASITATTV